MPAFGVNGFQYEVKAARSWYDALLVTLTHPLAKNLLVKVAYTWSKSIDNFPANPSNSNAERDKLETSIS